MINLAINMIREGQRGRSKEEKKNLVVERKTQARGELI